MFSHLQNKEKILLGKRATKVDHSVKGVTVHCKDGTSYDGDVVVCADGVHSQVRSEMWRNANLIEPTYFTEKEMTSGLQSFNDRTALIDEQK
jgi:2-polyprenyl-6-methoxyphenol hydroxylase-like FAD-dependent oxidoreductase